MRILITAFEPFGDCDINPSYELLKALPDNIDESSIIKQLLPVSFNNGFTALKNRLNEQHFDFMIMLGQYGGIEHIRLEMAGHNLISTKRADNDGNIPDMKPILCDAEYGYFTNIDLWKLSNRLKDKGFITEISESAGSYVCNYVYFSCLNYIKENNLDSKALFIHLPYIKEQGREPSLTIEEEYNTIIAILNDFVGGKN